MSRDPIRPILHNLPDTLQTSLQELEQRHPLRIELQALAEQLEAMTARAEAAEGKLARIAAAAKSDAARGGEIWWAEVVGEAMEKEGLLT